MDIEKALYIAIFIMEQINPIILNIYNTDFMKSVQYKEDQSPLSAADTTSHNYISAQLRNAFPDIPILSEESMSIIDQKVEYCWIIDPLDGTKEFIKRNGEFTVNIALVKEQRVILGVIGVPVSGSVYYAVKGKGAFRKEKNEVKQIGVSNKISELIFVGSKSHASDSETSLIDKNRHLIKKTISVGSSLKGIMVAEGTADIYYRFGPTYEWDTCAMQCIVEEAKGIFRQLDGTEMLYNRQNHLNDKGFYIVNRSENIWV